MALVDREQVERLMIMAGAIRSGLVDVLAAGPVTAAAAARTLAANRRAVRIVLDALVAIGVAEELTGDDSRTGDQTVAQTADQTEYRLTPLGRAHLVDPGPELERNWILHQSNKARGFYELPYVIAKGHQRPSLRAKRDAKACALTMGEGDPSRLDDIIHRILAYMSPRLPRNVLDVGGAVGHVSARFLAGGMRPTLLDLPEVIELAKLRLGADAARMDFCSCDFLQELPPGPFDLVYLGNVFHIYGPSRNASLVTRVAQILAPGGAVAAVDLVLERSPRARIFAVNMLQATKDGGVWREADFRGWFESAGLKDFEVQDLAERNNQLLLARRPDRKTVEEPRLGQENA